MLQDYLRLIRFDKPIGTLLLLWPTWWGLWFAYAAIPPLKILVVFSLGVFLTRAAGCAINDYADSDFDGAVERTANRPLVTGAISKKNALLVSAGLSLAAFILAAFTLHPLTLLWSIPALLIFVSYPFFKRFFAVPQLYLGVAFSFGILMAFIESSGHIPAVGWLIFIANIFWVLAYDTIYALVDLPDDLKIGIKTSAITFGKSVIPIIMLCYSMFLFIMCMVGVEQNMGITYFVTLLCELFLIYYVYQQIKNQNRQQCFKAFLFNNQIGILLTAGLIVDFWFK